MLMSAHDMLVHAHVYKCVCLYKFREHAYGVQVYVCMCVCTSVLHVCMYVWENVRVNESMCAHVYSWL